MTDPIENLHKSNPAEVFDAAIHQRQVELEYLLAGLRDGLEVIGDLDRVNAVILASPRPDLTLTQPTPMIAVEHPYDLGRVNNFIPNLRGFGTTIYEEEGESLSEGEHLKSLGRRLPTREELNECFFMGARGGYNEHMAFAEANGIGEKRALEILLQTHANKEAFMRMWVLFPELTETIIANCLDDRQSHNYKSLAEEIFVAYSLMSRLVDISDKGAVKEDGTIDTWLLCR